MGVALEHRQKPIARIAGATGDLSEVLEVPGHLAFVPGREDRFDT
jgi:hypothetical protein